MIQNLLARERLTEELLSIGLRREEGVIYSNGEQGNNIIDIDHAKLKKHPDTYKKVVTRICRLAEPYKPEFFIGIPDGATEIAETAAREYGIPVYEFNPRLIKHDPVTRKMAYVNALSRVIVQGLGSGVIIDDVLRKGSNLLEALEVPRLADNLVLSVSVYDRSMLGDDPVLPSHIDVVSVGGRPVPTMLEDDSVLWQYAMPLNSAGRP